MCAARPGAKRSGAIFLALVAVYLAALGTRGNVDFGKGTLVAPATRPLFDAVAALPFAATRAQLYENLLAVSGLSLEQYEKAPEVIRRRLYLETISEVLPQLGGKVILDADAKQFLPLMSLPAAVQAPQLPARRSQP